MLFCQLDDTYVPIIKNDAPRQVLVPKSVVVGMRLIGRSRP